MNVMTLARKQVEAVEAIEVADAPEALAIEDIPTRIELDMVSKGQKSENHRELFAGALDEARTVRATAYIPADMGLESINLKAKDAAVKVLDHGEVRFVWTDEDANILVKLFVPASEDVEVKSLSLAL